MVLIICTHAPFIFPHLQLHLLAMRTSWDPVLAKASKGNMSVGVILETSPVEKRIKKKRNDILQDFVEFAPMRGFLSLFVFTNALGGAHKTRQKGQGPARTLGISLFCFISLCRYFQLRRAVRSHDASWVLGPPCIAPLLQLS